MEDISRVLVRSGITRYCQKAVHKGISLARKFNAELFIVHVIHNPFGLKGWNVPMVSLEEEFKRLMEQAKNELDMVLEQEKANGVTIHEVIREGQPIEEILQLIENEKIDLLVLPSHPETRLMQFESRLERFLFGWGNDEIIRKMPCSILLVKDNRNI